MHRGQSCYGWLCIFGSVTNPSIVRVSAGLSRFGAGDLLRGASCLCTPLTLERSPGYRAKRDCQRVSTANTHDQSAHDLTQPSRDFVAKSMSKSGLAVAGKRAIESSEGRTTKEF
ncbi:hypothetical protein E8E14_005485 [Neopestalotiopsis sp. 37M]|nr:hypothetical protein E8E14_005485 [Neopestalotiopsis sp. 37M]